MNNERRKVVAKVLALIQDAQALLEPIAEEEREAYDNLPEGLQNSERGQTFEANASALEEALESLNSAVESLESG